MSLDALSDSERWELPRIMVVALWWRALTGEEAVDLDQAGRLFTDLLVAYVRERDEPPASESLVERYFEPGRRQRPRRGSKSAVDVVNDAMRRGALLEHTKNRSRDELEAGLLPGTERRWGRVRGANESLGLAVRALGENPSHHDWEQLVSAEPSLVARAREHMLRASGGSRLTRDPTSRVEALRERVLSELRLRFIGAPAENVREWITTLALGHRIESRSEAPIDWSFTLGPVELSQRPDASVEIMWSAGTESGVGKTTELLLRCWDRLQAGLSATYLPSSKTGDVQGILKNDAPSLIAIDDGEALSSDTWLDVFRAIADRATPAAPIAVVVAVRPRLLGVADTLAAIHRAAIAAGLSSALKRVRHRRLTDNLVSALSAERRHAARLIGTYMTPLLVQFLSTDTSPREEGGGEHGRVGILERFVTGPKIRDRGDLFALGEVCLRTVANGSSEFARARELEALIASRPGIDVRLSDAGLLSIGDDGPRVHDLIAVFLAARSLAHKINGGRDLEHLSALAQSGHDDGLTAAAMTIAYLTRAGEVAPARLLDAARATHLFAVRPFSTSGLCGTPLAWMDLGSDTPGGLDVISARAEFRRARSILWPRDRVNALFMEMVEDLFMPPAGGSIAVDLIAALKADPDLPQTTAPSRASARREVDDEDDDEGGEVPGHARYDDVVEWCNHALGLLAKSSDGATGTTTFVPWRQYDEFSPESANSSWAIAQLETLADFAAIDSLRSANETWSNDRDRASDLLSQTCAELEPERASPASNALFMLTLAIRLRADDPDWERAVANAMRVGLRETPAWRGTSSPPSREHEHRGGAVAGFLLGLGKTRREQWIPNLPQLVAHCYQATRLSRLQEWALALEVLGAGGTPLSVVREIASELAREVSGALSPEESVFAAYLAALLISWPDGPSDAHVQAAREVVADMRFAHGVGPTEWSVTWSIRGVATNIFREIAKRDVSGENAVRAILMANELEASVDHESFSHVRARAGNPDIPPGFGDAVRAVQGRMIPASLLPELPDARFRALTWDELLEHLERAGYDRPPLVRCALALLTDAELIALTRMPFSALGNFDRWFPIGTLPFR